jgi:hypothetical protein
MPVTAFNPKSDSENDSNRAECLSFDLIFGILNQVFRRAETFLTSRFAKLISPSFF